MVDPLAPPAAATDAPPAPVRPVVSVVVPAWNLWETTERCLAALRPTLSPRDEVIVVDNGSSDGTAAGLARLPWVTAIGNAANRGFAAACNQGAAVARGHVIVFLNNDTLPPPGWLDGLLRPFADAAVFATGPMSNWVSGPQQVDGAAYDRGSAASLHAFAAARQRAHAGRASETTRLVGFCLAVRASALRLVGGWDEGFGAGGAEDDDLCLRLRDAGGRLLICHDSFVHHDGHATFVAHGLDWLALQHGNLARLADKRAGRLPMWPRGDGPLLSACLIVRDERALLPACLAALRDVADEIVVYDTGSTDGTQGLAQAAGARVVQGDWDDDFGRARNAALQHCRGDWVLHVDADEVLEAEAAALRATLAAAPVPAFVLEILNHGGPGCHDVVHRACRLFRRELFHWRGRLHENVVYRTGRRDFSCEPLAGARLRHSGYTAERMAAKDKAARNLRLAELDRDAARHPLETRLNLARSQILAGRPDEALALFAEGRAIACDEPLLVRALHRSAAHLCLSIGRPADALAWIDGLERASSVADLARCLRGDACTALRRWGDALNAYGDLSEARDEDGNVLPAFPLHLNRARCHAGLRQWAAAADAAADAVAAAGGAGDAAAWPLLAESCHRAGRDFAAHLDTVSDARLGAVFAALARLDPDVADAVLEDLAGRPRYRAGALALAIRLAPDMAVAAAARWSARLRAIGLAEYCPPLDAPGADGYRRRGTGEPTDGGSAGP